MKKLLSLVFVLVFTAGLLPLAPSAVAATQMKREEQIGIAKVAAGFYHTLVIMTDGSLWAWGMNAGQIGDGTTTEKISPVRIGTDTDWENITAGFAHTVAIKTDGTLWAWGVNTNGRLGDGTTITRTEPVQIGSDTNWASVSAGHSNTLAIKTDGSLWAWGVNSNGKLGDGTTINRIEPTQIGKDTDWVSVSTGYSHTIAIKKDRSMWAWGSNSFGQFGNGTTGVDNPIPVQINNDKNWKSVLSGGGASGSYTIAIKNDGSLWAWGWNNQGQLGDGTTEQRKEPVRIGTENNWASVGETAGSDFTTAIKTDCSLWVWGDNYQGQHGNGTTTGIFAANPSPSQVGNEHNWAGVVAGSAHTVAIQTDGSLWAWGSNSSGQLGDGTVVNKHTPMRIPVKNPNLPITYTVTFVDWDGTVLKIETVPHLGTAIAPADPMREGYEFIRWDRDFSEVRRDLIVTAEYVQRIHDPKNLTIALTHKTVAPGENETLTLVVSNNNFVNLHLSDSMRLVYDPAKMTVYSAMSGEVDDIHFHDLEKYMSSYIPGLYRFAIEAGLPSGEVKNGILAVFTIHVKGGVAPGTIIPVGILCGEGTLSYEGMTENGIQRGEANLLTGFITVSNNSDYLIGDINGDGTINAADVTMLRVYLSDPSNLPIGFKPENADVNGDGKIDFEDVVLMRCHLAATTPSNVPFVVSSPFLPMTD